jgi:hypothetical protein
MLNLTQSGDFIFGGTYIYDGSDDEDTAIVTII